MDTKEEEEWDDGNADGGGVDVHVCKCACLQGGTFVLCSSSA